MSPAWRRRCPEGHASWRNRADGGIYCPQCDEHYDTTVDYGQHAEDTETIESFNGDS